MQKVMRQRGSRPGRHYVGIPGDIISECPVDFVGIRKIGLVDIGAPDGAAGESFGVLDGRLNVGPSSGGTMACSTNLPPDAGPLVMTTKIFTSIANDRGDDGGPLLFEPRPEKTTRSRRRLLLR